VADIKDKEILIFKDVSQLFDYAVEKWKEFCGDAIKNKGSFEVALSGGKTPIGLYRKLAGLKDSLPWDKTHIFMVDERLVPFDNSASNYRMIYETLLTHIYIPAENIHPIPTDDTPQASAISYEKDLIRHFKLKPGEAPEFDLILLGIGEDGHTASLFPDTPLFKEETCLAVAVFSPNRRERISLTLRVINNAKNIIFLVTGNNKAHIISEILEKDNKDLPASMVRPRHGRLFFLIDEQAASCLSPVRR
jgi:6-phosphogluconolactonase